MTYAAAMIKLPNILKVQINFKIMWPANTLPSNCSGASLPLLQKPSTPIPSCNIAVILSFSQAFSYYGLISNRLKTCFEDGWRRPDLQGRVQSLLKNCFSFWSKAQRLARISWRVFHPGTPQSTSMLTDLLLCWQRTQTTEHTFLFFSRTHTASYNVRKAAFQFQQSLKIQNVFCV